MNKGMKKAGILCDHLYGCNCAVGSKQCHELEIYVGRFVEQEKKRMSDEIRAAKRRIRLHFFENEDRAFDEALSIINKK